MILVTIISVTFMSQNVFAERLFKHDLVKEKTVYIKYRPDGKKMLYFY